MNINKNRVLSEIYSAENKINSCSLAIIELSVEAPPTDSMCSAIVYSCLVALKTPHTWSAHCVHHSHYRSDTEETLLRSLLTSRWTDKHKCTLDPVWCEPLREMLPCHRLNLAILQLCLLSLVSFTDSRSLKCSPGKVCSDRPPVVLSKSIYYRTSFFCCNVLLLFCSWRKTQLFTCLMMYCHTVCVSKPSEPPT